MNTTQLQCCIDCDSILRGHVSVCAADHLPDTLKQFPCGFIVNTDIHSKAGTHWCAFYFDQKGNGEFFDSYGHQPDYYNNIFPQFLKIHGVSHSNANRKRLQSGYSNACGLYCLFYLHQRFNGMSMNRIVHMFSDYHFSLNDLFVFQFMSQTFPYCVKDECVYNQTCKPLLVLKEL